MDPQHAVAEPLRLAIFATPRSGNTWFRALVTSAFGLTGYAAHDPDEIPWGSVADRSAVNLHWPPSERLSERLDGFRLIAIARHPLDTLISILHFSPHHASSNGWLGGRGGGEEGIRGASPESREFLDYATGPRAAALLSVSAEWWKRPGVLRIRYEDLVADAAAELRRVGDAIDAKPVVSLAEVVAAHALDAMRTRDRSHLHHMWQGQPGLWRRLVPARVARAVAEAHPSVFAALGYDCEPDESLTDVQARAAWLSLDAETGRRDAEQLWDLVQAMREAATEAEGRRAEAALHLGRSDALLRDSQARFAESETARIDLAERLLRVEDTLRETHDRLVRTYERLVPAEERAAVSEDRLTSAHETIERLVQQLESAGGYLIEADARVAAMSAIVVEAHKRLAETQSRLADSEERLAASRATADRLAGLFDAARLRLVELESRLSESAAQLAGTGPAGLAVARRLSDLSVRFPWLAQNAKRALSATHGLRRAG